MRLSPLIALALTLAAIGMPRSEPRPLKPYPPVSITLAGASDDESFLAFGEALAAVAKRRIYAELGRLVAPQGFFWSRDEARRFDPRRPAVDNLATALALEHDNGSGWDRLAAFAAQRAVEPLESRPGVVCAPARPNYDSIAFTRLLDLTYTVALDWAYPLRTEIAVRSAPQLDAAVIGTLGAHFVHRLERRDGIDATARWLQIATPDGKAGFVPPGALMSLATARLCYTKDIVAGWLVAGYIGASD